MSLQALTLTTILFIVQATFASKRGNLIREELVKM